MISGLHIKKLRKISDQRGSVMHMLRCDQPEFSQFGEIYFSEIFPKVIKGWKLHRKMTLNYAVPHGEIKVVLYDQRKDSLTFGEVNEIYLGRSNYDLLTIPPLIWTSFACASSVPAIVANCATIPHDPSEVLTCDIADPCVPYNWAENKCPAQS